MFTAAAPLPTGERTPPQDLAERIARFGVDLYQAIAAEEHGNIALSPYSIAVALQMVWHGAAGETADEIAATLHQTGSPADAHRQLFSMLNTELPGDALTLNTANTLWVQHGLHLHSAFADALHTGYDASPHRTDFIRDAESVRQEINRVIAGQTGGHIVELLDQGSIGRLTRLVLANACYLLLRWDEPFPPEATTEQPFHIPDREPVAVPMMRRKAVFGYLRGDGYEAVSLPDASGQLAVTILLPAGPKLLAQLRKRGLLSILANLRPTELTLTLPRFRLHGNSSLNTMLQQLGIRRAFDKGRAEFTNITDDEPLYLSNVVHGIELAVDERGAEAAAATAAVISTISLSLPPREVTVDRPFLFAITHSGTGLPLLFGRVQDPSVT
ncbi:MAG TPA: serpin family protein [Pseudonocardiaceae bacterium]|jgi:serpin B|nr:serpin family protein [Pseudonocardiaceae bacterium]